MQIADSLLIRHFREFYAEMSALASRVTAAAEGETPQENGDPSADSIADRLIETLHRLRAEASRTASHYPAQIYEEAQYVMVALADELFIFLPWGSGDYWKSNHLENRLHQTYVAGDLIFWRIDRLLSRRDPFSVELAAVYHLALSLGFQGKFRLTKQDDQVLAYQTSLFEHVFGRKPQSGRKLQRLTGQAYAHTLKGGSAARLVNPRNWYLGLGLVLLLLLAISQWVWRSETAQLRNEVQKVTQVSRGQPTSP